MKLVATLAAFAAVFFLLRVWQGRRKKLPVARFDAEFLAKRLGMDLDALVGFEPRYRNQRIDKRGPYRSGEREKRSLNIPDPETMRLQRRIHDRILRRLRVHSAVQGFEKGCSVARNAALHSHRAVVLKLDLVSFFDSTRAERVLAYFRRIGWDEEAAAILTRLTTFQGGLPQGAPTSPALSNRICFALDHAIHIEAIRRFGRYSRYADDLTISFFFDYPQQIRGMVRAVQHIANRYGYRVHHHKKLRVLRKHQSQQVTGLVVNEGPRLPRKTRRWLRAVEHRIQTGGLATLSPKQLAGWKAYKADVDKVRQELHEETKASIVAALERARGSLTGAAAELDWPLPILKQRMKYFGLWRDKPQP